MTVNNNNNNNNNNNYHHQAFFLFQQETFFLFQFRCNAPDKFKSKVLCLLMEYEFALKS